MKKWRKEGIGKKAKNLNPPLPKGVGVLFTKWPWLLARAGIILEKP
jgi:hypothetical protein